ncbi:MAG: pilus assembly protein PilB [Rheinheimera sp.]|uniref:response regulator n=1 Tax=Arsukibacterium sp. UBA3155 TaxID=1946058 RepID=UPI000C98FE52|nr:response regulator [Arsukibacterium sp. UBA3155]MAD74735.1 pilus assembly protein PilB [Rheinheimera sp.]|tara:strand:- start:18861 stop:19232 length:372 start_codon:yes stop_codon:yes gene_type:complete
MFKLLFVDDDPFVLSAYQRMLHKTPYHCHVLQWPEHLMTLPDLTDFHIAFIDQQMPGVSGSELLLQLQQRYPAIKRVLVSGDVEFALQQKSAELILDAVVNKPCSKSSLISCIEQFAKEQSRP